MQFLIWEKLTPVLKKLFGAEGFNYAWNEGKVSRAIRATFPFTYAAEKDRRYRHHRI